MKLKYSRTVPLVFWLAFIFLVSVQTEIPIISSLSNFLVGGQDISWLHVPLYFMLSALLVRFFVTDKFEHADFVLSITAATLYGVLMEYAQFSFGHVFSASDLLLNFIGASIILVFLLPRVKSLLKIDL